MEIETPSVPETTPEENGGTATPETGNTNVEVKTPETTPTQPEQEERRYAKSEVVEMMRNRVNRSHQAFFNRYGVKDLAEMDSKFAKIAEYEKQIADLGVTNSGLVRDNAYLKHNIEPNRYGDVEAYFKGKDLKINSDTLAQEIATHPEWVKAAIQPVPKASIQVLGPEERGSKIEETDEEKMNRIYGI